MGMQKAYSVKEYRQIFSGRKFPDGAEVRIVDSSKPWLIGLKATVEKCYLSLIERGLIRYQVKIGDGAFDSVHVDQKQLQLWEQTDINQTKKLA